MAQKLYSVPRLRAVILSEATNQRSRENIVVLSDGALFQSGALLTQSGDAASTGIFAAVAGNTGNPTVPAGVAVGQKGIPGVYTMTFSEATKFRVEDPQGALVGTGTLGQAFNKGGLTFTPAAGGTAAVNGDAFTITVAPGDRKYSRYTPNGAAGPADAVLYASIPAVAAGTNVKAVGFVRSAELNRFELTGLDAAGQADLATKGLIVRGTPGLPGISTPAL